MTTELLITLITIASVHLVAVASPGPDFALIVKNSISKGRKAGLASSFGIGIAAGLHVIFVLTGIAFLVTQLPPLFLAIQYGGAAYLIYIGIKSLLSKPSDNVELDQIKSAQNKPKIKALPFFAQGFMTNLLNPKAWIYFTAVFAQFIKPDMLTEILASYWLTIMTIQITWFSGLSLFLTHTAIRARFIAISHWIERICGGLLVALGVKLAVTRL